MSDPNFPPSLDIHPFIVPDVSYVPEDQKQDIALYGIAGRVWEASKPLIRYFTPSLQSSFDPPCPIFQHTPPRKIIELGSGQALASLHLAQQLEDADTLVLTDLPNVVPLCEQSALSWSVKNPKAGQVSVRPLAWGGDCSSALSLGPFDYIIMCDLIYFPHLYPLLLHTLLQLTESNELPSRGPTYGPTIVLSYFSRTLALEESFFQSFGQYFELSPVIGLDGDAKMYLCRRWQVTEEWSLPQVDKIMNGAKGIIRGRDFGLVDELFASIEF